jgi:hypothetical protein
MESTPDTREYTKEDSRIIRQILSIFNRNKVEPNTALNYLSAASLNIIGCGAGEAAAMEYQKLEWEVMDKMAKFTLLQMEVRSGKN